jgi:hypothetical protein
MVIETNDAIFFNTHENVTCFTQKSGGWRFSPKGYVSDSNQYEYTHHTLKFGFLVTFYLLFQCQ